VLSSIRCQKKERERGNMPVIFTAGCRHEGRRSAEGKKRGNGNEHQRGESSTPSHRFHAKKNKEREPYKNCTCANIPAWTKKRCAKKRKLLRLFPLISLPPSGKRLKRKEEITPKHPFARLQQPWKEGKSLREKLSHAFRWKGFRRKGKTRCGVSN